MNGTWSNSSGDLHFKTDGDYSQLIGVNVDGARVAPSNYTVAPGSTHIYLKAAFLKTLSVGKHTLTALYTNGEAETEFTILGAAPTPTETPTPRPTETPEPTPTETPTPRPTKTPTPTAAPRPTKTPSPTKAPTTDGTGRNTVPRTGDESMPVIWMLLMGFSAIGIVAVLGRKRKKN